MILQNEAATRSSVSALLLLLVSLPFHSADGSRKINDECTRDNFVCVGWVDTQFYYYIASVELEIMNKHIWRGRDKSVGWRVFIGLELSAQSGCNGKIKSSRRRVGAWRLLKSALWWMCGPVGARVSCFFERVWRRHARNCFLSRWTGVVWLVTLAM